VSGRVVGLGPVPSPSLQGAAGDRTEYVAASLCVAINWAAREPRARSPKGESRPSAESPETPQGAVVWHRAAGSVAHDRVPKYSTFLLPVSASAALHVRRYAGCCSP
jgi:hypothetical protein